ncbi:MAG: bifunctional nuclease family protein [bacterium]|nr:bifunctional nuclease family protein [bacterium]
MQDGLVEVRIRGVIPTPGGFAVFLQDGSKTFVIYVDGEVGAAIHMFMEGAKKPRPLTHDLIGSILEGFEVRVDRVVINDLRDNTFFARLFLVREDESGKRIVEIDARPSDCLALARLSGARIYVAPHVLDAVSDVGGFLKEQDG